MQLLTLFTHLALLCCQVIVELQEWTCWDKIIGSDLGSSGIAQSALTRTSQ